MIKEETEADEVIVIGEEETPNVDGRDLETGEEEDK